MATKRVSGLSDSCDIGHGNSDLAADLTSNLEQSANSGRPEVRDSTRTTDEALVMLSKLRGYVLPAGRIPVLREIARRISGIADPDEILNALAAFERELIAHGAMYEPEIDAAVASVGSAFPGVQLLGLRKLLP
jgi:hypothetical protein